VAIRDGQSSIPQTVEDARRFLGATYDDALGALWRLALSSGLRRGELLALRWQDVNLDAGRLVVKQSLVMLNGKAALQPTTSKAAIRSVKLSADAIGALKAQKDRQARAPNRAGGRWQESGLVFTSSIGTALSPRNVGRSFDEVIARRRAKDATA
jgi:integrase